MSGQEYAPGTVAMVRCSDGEERRAHLNTYGTDWIFADGMRRFVVESEARPLVVLDPVAITGPDETGDGDPRVEIARCLTRLAEAEGASVSQGSYRGRIAARIAEAFEIPDPKPEVYEHLAVTSRVGSGPYRALCGKVWVPSKHVTVLGACPDCVNHIESGWIA